MVVDFYEFTMANCLFLHGYKDTKLVFDMLPQEPGRSGLFHQRRPAQADPLLMNYHFNAQDIWWLRTKGMSEEFCEYLRTYQWKGDMYALPEGTVCYPNVQMVRIECDMVGAILIETSFCRPSLPQPDRHQGHPHRGPEHPHPPQRDGVRHPARPGRERRQRWCLCGGVRGGCVGTANCLAEMKYGAEVKAVGTVAHSFIEFFPTEFEAFKAFADTYPESVSLLLDTYNIMESGLPNLSSWTTT